MLFDDLEQNYVNHSGMVLPTHVRMLVTGLPRGGTFYISDALTRAGIPTSHEMYYSQQGQRRHTRTDYFPRIEVSGFMYPWMRWIHEGGASCWPDSDGKNHLRFFMPVYHVIRHPVNQISSILNYFHRPDSPPDWTAKNVEYTWLQAHTRNEEYAIQTFRMEDMQDTVKALYYLYEEYTGNDYDEPDWDKVFREAQVGSSTPEKRITWDELDPETREYAKRFDYGP